jgi:hypothetical protein
MEILMNTEAEVLGINPKTFELMMQRLGIQINKKKA